MGAPFTGNVYADLLIAALFLLAGLWFAFRRKHWVGWVIIGAAAWWGWLLYPKLNF
jgi:hypothetical protein